MQDVLEPQVKTRAGLEPRRGQKRESTQPLPDLGEDVTSTVLVKVVLLQFRESRARVLTSLTILLWL